MKYVSIDLETTGLNPRFCRILEIGAVIDDLDGETNPNVFQTLIQHDRIEGEPFALQMNAGILRELANPSGDIPISKPGEVVWKFRYWLRANEIDPDQPINVAGKNFASFDWDFLEELPDWSSHIRIRGRVLDPAILYVNPLKDDALPGLSTCLKRAGLDSTVTHRAVDDAMAVVRLIRKHFGKLS